MKPTEHPVLIEAVPPVAEAAAEAYGRAGPGPASNGITGVDFTGSDRRADLQSTHFPARATRLGLANLEHGRIQVFTNPRSMPPQAHALGSSPEAIASIDEIKTKLGLSQFPKLNGEGVYVAIVDDGINPASLEERLSSRLKQRPPTYDRQNSVVQDVPDPFSRGKRTHGTMSAFDLCIVAPKCTLLDFAINAPQEVDEPRIRDAIAVYKHILALIESHTIPPPVVLNCWQVRPEDEIGGIPTDDPRHPFYQAIADLERAGADIVFSVPDHHLPVIAGPAAHPAVLSVTAVDVEQKIFATAAHGRLQVDREGDVVAKPDVACYEGFRGYELFAGSADYGTSSAAALAGGVIAAVRTTFGDRAALPPSQLRALIRQTAGGLPPPRPNPETGYGLIQPPELVRELGGPGPAPLETTRKDRAHGRAEKPPTVSDRGSSL